MAHVQSRFLALPRELRDEIYAAYLFASDGYTYDFDAGKLRMAGGQPIDLALMYTCRRIGCEMQGLALRVNTVRFSTLYTDELRTRAGRWAWVTEEALQPCAVTAAVEHLTEEAFGVAVQAVDHSVFAAVARNFRPHLRAHDPGWVSVRGGQKPTYGEAPSVSREAQQQFMQLALADSHMKQYFDSDYKANYSHRVPGHVPYLHRLASQGPWSIPTEEELDAHTWQVPSKAALGGKGCDMRRDKSFWDAYRGKPRFSAAAAAIHFLNSLPLATRTQLRKMVVHEDRLSVCCPASHVRGLVPFCRENPALRIERRVDLWWNCFMNARPDDFLGNTRMWLVYSTHIDNQQELVSAEEITEPVAEWMVEASHPSIPEAITLTLDGGPAPDHMARIFQEVVQRDAAWQTAVVRAFTSEHHPYEFLRGRSNDPFMYEGFPELLQAICDNPTNLRVRCNFDPGRRWDDAQIDEVVDANKGLSPWEWGRAWLTPEAKFRPPPPMPDFHSMKQEYVFPDAWIERFWETLPAGL